MRLPAVHKHPFRIDSGFWFISLHLEGCGSFWVIGFSFDSEFELFSSGLIALAELLRFWKEAPWGFKGRNCDILVLLQTGIFVYWRTLLSSVPTLLFEFWWNCVLYLGHDLESFKFDDLVWIVLVHVIWPRELLSHSSDNGSWWIQGLKIASRLEKCMTYRKAGVHSWTRHGVVNCASLHSFLQQIILLISSSKGYWGFKRHSELLRKLDIYWPWEYIRVKFVPVSIFNTCNRFENLAVEACIV